MFRPSCIHWIVSCLVALTASCSQPSPPAAAAPMPSAAAVAANPSAGDPLRGVRVATRVGCNGCHGRDAAGSVFIDNPAVGRVVAPNLTERRHHYDAVSFAALLRDGRTADGHSPLGMPIMMFQHLSDRDVRDLWAWLGGLPDIAHSDLPATELSAQVAAAIKDGTLPNLADVRPDPGNVPPAEPPAERIAFGRYLAMTSCTECHGRSLESLPGDMAPSLIAAKAYSAAHFARLMKTGITASGKPSDTGLMTEVGRYRFSSMSDDEVAALKAYLDAR